MARQDEIVKERLRKIKELRDKGINPYPYSFDKKSEIKELRNKYSKLKKEDKSKEKVKTAGRLISSRDLGKITFGVIYDGTSKIQIVLQMPDTLDEKREFYKKYVDVGDFIGVEGNMYVTQRGELSVLVQDLVLLGKSIFPLPEKWHGLQDKEERYRKRHLDLIMNEEVKEVFLKRNKIISLIREFLNSKDFVEVETPVLQPLYGGTNARPFDTHLNALDLKLYLRLAPELYLKRLVIGGFEKVYEIGRNFRNEGIDYMHNPEFTMIEWYEAYADYNKMMDNAEDLYKFVALKLNNSYDLEFKGNKLNLKGKWQRLPMTEAIKKELKIEVEKMSVSELTKFARENKLEVKKEIKGIIINEIFDKLVAKKLKGPIWIIDYPKEISPLAKPHRNKEGYVERFECYISGEEIGDGWSEIIDPQDQQSRFENEQKSMREGNAEAHPLDAEFINAMKHGMPVLGGIGIGIDRLVMVFTNAESIRDVLLFPFMRPVQNEKNSKEVN